MKVQVALLVLAVASFASGQENLIGGVWTYLGRFGNGTSRKSDHFSTIPQS
jgi:hypothetical protein